MNTEHESTKNPEVPPSREVDTANTKVEHLEKRIAELETVVRLLRIHTRMPFGKFAHLGGYEVLPPREFTTPEPGKPPIDFTSIGGKRVG